MDEQNESSVLQLNTCMHRANWEHTPEISVVILNWNQSQLLDKCLASVYAERCKHIEIVVIDNGSTDNSLAMVRQKYPETVIIENGANLGFSKGYNQGIRYTNGSTLVLLNNDTEVEPGWLEPLVTPVINDSRIGITSPLIVIWGTRLLDNAGGYFKLWTGLGPIGRGRDWTELYTGNYEEPFYASGCALAIRKTTYELIGGLDEGSFAYGEDLELSWKARLAGFKIVNCRDSIVQHHMSATWGAMSPHHMALHNRNNLRAYLTCLSWPNLLHSVPAQLAFGITMSAGLAVVQHDLSYLIDTLKGYWSLFQNRREVLVKRKSNQRLRVQSDWRVLFAGRRISFFDTPFRYWRTLKLYRRLDRIRADHKLPLNSSTKESRTA